MLKFRTAWQLRNERGDTLIEVTFALAILGFVLLGSTAIAAAAFRTGQTARERTQISEAAQQQMEALRTFRDNHTWAQFQKGDSGVGYKGVDDVAGSFHMVLAAAGSGTNDWVPVAGSLASTVPTSLIEISTSTPGTQRLCAYDFELHYSFTPLGGGGGVLARNQIVTRLANLKYVPPGTPPVADCPL